MLGLLYGLIEGSTSGWGVVPVVSVAVGVLFFAAFAHRQHTAIHPLITPLLLRNRGFTSGMTVGLVAGFGRGLVFVGLAVSLIGCGWVLVLVDRSGTNVGLWALAPAFAVIGNRYRPLLHHHPHRCSRRREA